MTQETVIAITGLGSLIVGSFIPKLFGYKKDGYEVAIESLEKTVTSLEKRLDDREKQANIEKLESHKEIITLKDEIRILRVQVDRYEIFLAKSGLEKIIVQIKNQDGKIDDILQQVKEIKPT